MTSFELTNEFENGFHGIRITEGEFKDIEFCYGAVAVEEDQEKDCVTLKFDYNLLLGNPKANLSGFTETIGDILVHLIDEQIKNNEVVYYGGVDE